MHYRHLQPKYGHWAYIKHKSKHEEITFLSLSITLGLLSLLAVHLGIYA